MKKKLLLTGGTGFIGRNLKISRLAEIYCILAPTRQELNLLDDISVRQYLRNNPIDVVIHSAIKPAHRAAQDKSNIFIDNSKMFLNLINNRAYFNRLIHMGSGAGYDSRFYEPKMKEEYLGVHVPEDDLGLYKFMVGRFASEVDWILDLRLFGVYGKYENYSIRFISNLICKMLFNLPLTMTQDRKFDYLYVDDLPKIIEYFVENKWSYKSFNITPDKSESLKDIAYKIREIGGSKLPIILNREGVGLEYSGCNDRLRNEIPNLELTDIETGIRELIDYYKINMDKIDKNLLGAND